MAGGLHGQPPDLQGASQLMSEQRQGRSSKIPVTCWNVSSHTSMCECCTDSLYPGHHTIRKLSLVAPKARQLGRWPSACPALTSHMHCGRMANNVLRCIYGRLRAHTGGSGPRHHTSIVGGIATKCMSRLQFGKLYDYHIPCARVGRVPMAQQARSRRAEMTRWPGCGPTPVVNITTLEEDIMANRAAEQWASDKEN